MKQSQITITILEPEEGNVLTNSAQDIFTDKVYLGQNDSPDNWSQITTKKATTLKAAIETKLKLEIEQQEILSNNILNDLDKTITKGI